MSDNGKTEETGHTFWWVIEDGEIVDWQIEHPTDCYEEEEWNGWMVRHAKCATDFATECDALEIFEDLWKDSPNGEHRRSFDSQYSWWYDSFSGEHDHDFTWVAVCVVPSHE